jgi:hypothetical protein
MQKADVKLMSEGQMPEHSESGAGDQQGVHQPVSDQIPGSSTTATVTHRSSEQQVASMRSIEEAVEQAALQTPAAQVTNGLGHGGEGEPSDASTGMFMIAGEGDVTAATSAASA